MSCITPIVFVVDDDVSVRESLELMISSAGWRPEIFASAREFLLHPRVLAPSCLVVCTENLIRLDDVMESPKLAE
jgi:FixJ family two-component response regulator